MQEHFCPDYKYGRPEVLEEYTGELELFKDCWAGEFWCSEDSNNQDYLCSWSSTFIAVELRSFFGSM